MIETILLAEKALKSGEKGLTFNTRKVILANKADLKLSKHILTIEDKNLIRDFGRFDVSAMTNYGISEVIQNIVTSLANDTFILKELQEKLLQT